MVCLSWGDHDLSLFLCHPNSLGNRSTHKQYDGLIMETFWLSIKTCWYIGEIVLEKGTLWQAPLSRQLYIVWLGGVVWYMMTWTPALCWTPGPSHTRLMDLASSWEICHVSITRQPSNYLIQQQTWRIALLQANTNLGNKQQNIRQRPHNWLKIFSRFF